MSYMALALGLDVCPFHALLALAAATRSRNRSRRMRGSDHRLYTRLLHLFSGCGLFMLFWIWLPLCIRGIVLEGREDKDSDLISLRPLVARSCGQR